jgi:Phage-related lysozyme (muraminidase)
MSEQHINEAGLHIIQSIESLRLQPYLDGGGVATIGWGHAIYSDGKQLKGIPGLVAARALYPNGWTKEQADQQLAEDCLTAEKIVNENVTVPLNNNQFSALVSFVFNVGGAQFAGDPKRGKKPSTLLTLLNQGNYAGAAEQFSKWIYDNGKVQGGLVRRRTEEKELFLAPLETLNDSGNSAQGST